MIFKDLYEKPIDRIVNSVVAASDLNDETIRTEIEEYVFTQEIITNLYNVLLNIKKNQGKQVGIWINGYYGSGKSHFLKYTSYCLSSEHRVAERAFDRLIEAAREIINADDDPLALMQANVSVSELQSLKKWYVEKAKVEMIMFNIGEVHDANADQGTALVEIFWNQFNEMRGFNSFNLMLAQYLEKPLCDHGKFEEFKERVRSENYDWDNDIVTFAGAALEKALSIANEVDGDLSIEAIRSGIINKGLNISPRAFITELKQYIKDKDENYRMLFFVDEVSQFMGEHREQLLTLQSLVESLYDACDSKVWIACTAQQTLEDVVTEVGANGVNPNDDIGKILGRFKVRASLEGTSSEYITQKRILEKNGNAEIFLDNMYKKCKPGLDAQFILPDTHMSYKDEKDFIAYYPFVPYQFGLITRVLDSFVNMNFVDREVKGNERSLLNITFSIAKETAEHKVGEFIPFDRFFGPIFQKSLTQSGRVAKRNADQVVSQIEDREKQDFYRRVEYILFMLCNLGEADKPRFSATIENVVTLMMTKIDDNRAVIKDRVEQALTYLMDNSIIRKERTQSGFEVYEFYSEDERNVAELIKNERERVDSHTYAEELNRIISDYFNPNTKETYATRSFSVGANVNTRHYLSNNADVEVDFLSSSYIDSPERYAMSNPQNHLVFFFAKQWKDDEALRQSFLYYCGVQKYVQQPASTEVRQRTNRKISEMAKQRYDEEIKPKIHNILDTCPVISGQNVLTAIETGTVRSRDRYKKVILCHLGKLYPFAGVVDTANIPRNQNDLRNKMLLPADQTLMETPLSTAEQKMKDYLERQPYDVTVDDVVRNFEKVPYGWSEFASIYVLNELVRRYHYNYVYGGDPNVRREYVAQNILRERTRFTVEKAKEIPQTLLNSFIAAWKQIFNVMSVHGGNDPMELYRNCRESENSALNKRLQEYKTISRKLTTCPFVGKIDEAVNLMESWAAIRDQKKFFETISDAKDSATALFDHCKKIKSFADDQYDSYADLISFLDGNRDNFTFLPPESKGDVVQISAIRTDMEPWDRIPAYNKLRRGLENQLKQCRDELVEKVKVNYGVVFDELEEYAKSMGVPADKFADREKTIADKTETTNLFALKTAADVDTFRGEQLNRINAARPTPPPTKPTTESADPNVSPAPVRNRISISLNTRTTKPMHTEEEVDTYLKRLKAEIMEYIKQENDVIIN